MTDQSSLFLPTQLNMRPTCYSDRNGEPIEIYKDNLSLGQQDKTVSCQHKRRALSHSAGLIVSLLWAKSKVWICLALCWGPFELHLI